MIFTDNIGNSGGRNKGLVYIFFHISKAILTGTASIIIPTIFTIFTITITIVMDKTITFRTTIARFSNILGFHCMKTHIAEKTGIVVFLAFFATCDNLTTHSRLFPSAIEGDFCTTPSAFLACEANERLIRRTLDIFISIHQLFSRIIMTT